MILKEGQRSMSRIWFGRMITTVSVFLLFMGLIVSCYARECTIEITQDGQKISPVIEGNVPTYKLRADTFRIKVDDPLCNPGIYLPTDARYTEYLRQTPTIFAPAGFGIAERFESVDVLESPYYNHDPRSTIDDLIKGATRNTEVARAEYEDLSTRLSYRPTPAKPYARHIPFTDPETKKYRGFAEFRRWTNCNPMRDAAGLRYEMVVYTTIGCIAADRFCLFNITKPNVMTLEFRPGPSRRDAFPVAELTSWKKWFAQRSGDDKAIYCLLGNGPFRSVSSGEEDSFIAEWLSKHPKAKVTPVTVMGDSSKTQRQFVYVWISDGSENLNLELIGRGALPGSVMLDAVDFFNRIKEKPDKVSEQIRAAVAAYSRRNPNSSEKESQPCRLVSDAVYKAFLRELLAAEDSARSRHLGVWSDKDGK